MKIHRLLAFREDFRVLQILRIRFFKSRREELSVNRRGLKRGPLSSYHCLFVYRSYLFFEFIFKLVPFGLQGRYPGDWR